VFCVKKFFCWKYFSKYQQLVNTLDLSIKNTQGFCWWVNFFNLGIIITPGSKSAFPNADPDPAQGTPKMLIGRRIFSVRVVTEGFHFRT